MASDSEDEGGFLDRDLADNSKNSSTSYPVASASRCQVSKSLSSLASQHLNDMRITIRHSDEDECCADSGVTNHMFKDYSTFVSYHKCQNSEIRRLHRTPHPGLWYCQIQPNGKNNSGLLTDPMYSLCQHRYMEGCGFFSHYDSDAFLLFPNFTIKVDDTDDCLLYFKAIGNTPNTLPDYVEHRASADEDISDDTALSLIRQPIPDSTARSPLSSSFPPNPPTQKPTDSDMTPTTIPTELDLSPADIEKWTACPLSKRLLTALDKNLSNLPDIGHPTGLHTRTL